MGFFLIFSRSAYTNWPLEVAPSPPYPSSLSGPAQHLPPQILVTVSFLSDLGSVHRTNLLFARQLAPLATISVCAAPFEIQIAITSKSCLPS